MLPIFFGDPQQALFGIYHPSKEARVQPVSAVLCHPFGNEYVAAYRTMRVLAERLAAAGVSVLRFDYFGTGDSTGSSTATSITQWLKDLDSAIEEVKGTSDTTRTSLIGLRLGGTLAALAASRRNDIDRVVLWEPVLQGQEHVALHLERHQEWLQTDRCRVEDSTDSEALGHPFPDALLSEMSELNLLRQIDSQLERVLLLYHNNDRKQTDDTLSQLGRHVEQCVVNSADFWLGRTSFDQPLVSAKDVQSIVAWLTGEA